MSLIVTITYATEEGLSVRFHQDSPESCTKISLSNGKHELTQNLDDEVFNAFDSDCYASRVLGEMVTKFMEIYKEDF